MPISDQGDDVIDGHEQTDKVENENHQAKAVANVCMSTLVQ